MYPRCLYLSKFDLDEEKDANIPIFYNSHMSISKYITTDKKYSFERQQKCCPLSFIMIEYSINFVCLNLLFCLFLNDDYVHDLS